MQFDALWLCIALQRLVTSAALMLPPAQDSASFDVSQTADLASSMKDQSSFRQQAVDVIEEEDNAFAPLGENAQITASTAWKRDDLNSQVSETADAAFTVKDQALLLQQAVDTIEEQQKALATLEENAQITTDQIQALAATHAVSHDSDPNTSSGERLLIYIKLLSFKALVWVVTFALMGLWVLLIVGVIAMLLWLLRWLWECIKKPVKKEEVTEEAKQYVNKVVASLGKRVAAMSNKIEALEARVGFAGKLQDKVKNPMIARRLISNDHSSDAEPSLIQQSMQSAMDAAVDRAPDVAKAVITGDKEALKELMLEVFVEAACETVKESSDVNPYHHVGGDAESRDDGVNVNLPVDFGDVVHHVDGGGGGGFGGGGGGDFGV